ncbi:TetR family transcriptional regulator [Oceanicola sp. 22II-s10i]|uniref:TetR/AcrR family transcriptional regulator n=1 Tax=Oceanicola sp. 22II-s10i TaxID=1317116 RepID=UPI000B528989|nr:TetR/AcrR family transcriptional regulator [Oceanicola sp. 22II-s10i]OWU85191.1 TetR family transcriptional regulator [Oceanicola sp. 22II-s10i]
MSARAIRGTARTALLDAALGLIRTRGFAATSVDDLCAAAGVTKGAFFHHFSNKEALAVAATEHWTEVTGAAFNDAPYHRADDPLERVIGYLEFRKAILQGELPDYTCLLGTMVQETYADSPAIRAACHTGITAHAATLEPDIAAAMAAHGVTGITPESFALHTQAVIQGAFILAKAKNDTAIAAETIDHLIRYTRLLFGQPASQGEN